LRYLPILLIVASLAACSDSGGTNTGLFTGDSVAQDDSATDDAMGNGDIAAADVEKETQIIPTTCEPGDFICINGKLASCDADFGWLLEICPEGTKCDDGECVKSECDPLSARCNDNSVEICSPDGTGWSKSLPCPEEKICLEGTCVLPQCEPGESVCADQSVLTCADDGLSWFVTPCGDAEICFDGQCIECVKDADCPAGKACVEGLCEEPPLEWITKSLPDGVVGEDYNVQLDVEGGIPPYYFDLIAGDLPAGITLDSDAGLLSGTPTEAGNATITIELSDDLGNAEPREFTLDIISPPGSVVVTTGSPLPGGEEGESYSLQLEASGGSAPYTWGIIEGALPAGLIMTSSGSIEGVLADHGTFTFTVKVFDNGMPVGVGSKEFELTITVAPLEIIGGQEYDLFITKIIVLPLITTLELIPIPYSTQLEAKGGVKPYHWSEQPMPGFVEFLIANGGLPDGLTLEDDGELHGSSNDADDVVSISIPFTGIDLTGYFFMGEVKDSQDPQDSDSAIYLIPTIPVGF
jgi:hypothetical protein